MADKDMKWKTLSQKYLIEKPWLTARVDKVEFLREPLSMNITCWNILIG